MTTRRLRFGGLLALAMIYLSAVPSHAQRTTGTQGISGNPNCPPPVLPGGIVPKNWSCRTGVVSRRWWKFQEMA